MEHSDFESMTNSKLIDYHLEKGQQSEALSIYVQRLNKDPNTVWIKPEANMEELDKLMRSLQNKDKNKL